MSDISPAKLIDLSTASTANDNMLILVDPTPGGDLSNMKIGTLKNYFLTSTGGITDILVDSVPVTKSGSTALIELASRFNAKADVSYVTSQLALKVNTDTFNTSINNLQTTKADASAVSSALSLKADKTYVDTNLNNKVDKQANSRLITNTEAAKLDSMTPADYVTNVSLNGVMGIKDGSLVKLTGGGGVGSDLPDPAGTPGASLMVNPETVQWDKEYIEKHIIAVGDTLPVGTFNDGDLTYLSTDNYIYRYNDTSSTWVQAYEAVNGTVYITATLNPYILNPATNKLAALVPVQGGTVNFDDDNSVTGILKRQYGGTGTSTQFTGLVKANTNAFEQAVSGTDYIAPEAGKSLVDDNEISKLATVAENADVSPIIKLTQDGQDLPIVNHVVEIPKSASWNIFDIKYSDHQLSGQDALGWLLDGGKTTLGDTAANSKMSALYAEATDERTETFINGTNYINNGSVQISPEYIARGFSPRNNIGVPDVLPFTNTDTWEIKTKIIIGDNATTQQAIFGSRGDGSAGDRQLYAPMLAIHSSRLQLFLSGNGSTWNIVSGVFGTYILAQNTPLWIKLKKTATQYIVSYSVDGLVYIDDITIDNSSQIIINSGYSTLGFGNMFGGASYQLPFYNQIDLKETSILINDVEWWNALEYRSFPYRRHSDGWQLALQADRANIDTFFLKTGSAPYYIIDDDGTVFMPRDNNFMRITNDISKVNEFESDAIRNITGGFALAGASLSMSPPGQSAAIQAGAIGANTYGNAGYTGTPIANTVGDRDISFDASRVVPIATENRPKNVKYLRYHCVGNTLINTAEIDGAEIAVQVSQNTSNIANMQAVMNLDDPVIEYFNDPTNRCHYVKYKSGRLMQWGNIPKPPVLGLQWINFAVPFKDTKYAFIKHFGYYFNEQAYYRYFSYDIKYVDSISIWETAASDTANRDSSYIAIGYYK